MSMPAFYFNTRITQVELLGKKAKNVKELVSFLKKVPATSVYHHTHRYLEQHRYFSPEHPNDFSYWVVTSLGLKKLGERIASVDLFQFSDIEDLRKAFIAVLENFLKDTPVVRNCLPGEEFHFLSSKIFIVPTPFAADTLKQFVQCLERVTVHSLYFHMFEARMRLKKRDNDFACWFRDNGFVALADKLSRIDPYTFTLEGLRRKLIEIIQKA